MKRNEYPLNLLIEVFGLGNLDEDDNGTIDKLLTYHVSDIMEDADSATSLTERQKEILLSYYRDGEKLSTIAQRYNISNSRVRQIKENALRKLRHPNNTRILKEGKGKALKEKLPSSEGVFHCGFKISVASSLYNSGFKTVQDVIDAGPEKLLSLRYIGPGNLRRMIPILQRYGLTGDWGEFVADKQTKGAFMGKCFYCGKRIFANNKNYCKGEALFHGELTEKNFCCEEHRKLAIEKSKEKLLLLIEEIGKERKKIMDDKRIEDFTAMLDCDCSRIYEGDEVSVFGQKGTVVFECGAFGIAFTDYINWDMIEEQIKPVTGCNNPLYACRNDNFVSLWELYWNFNGEDNVIPVVEKINKEN